MIQRTRTPTLSGGDAGDVGCSERIRLCGAEVVTNEVRGGPRLARRPSRGVPAPTGDDLQAELAQQTGHALARGTDAVDGAQLNLETGRPVGAMRGLVRGRHQLSQTFVLDRLCRWRTFPSGMVTRALHT